MAKKNNFFRNPPAPKKVAQTDSFGPYEFRIFELYMLACTIRDTLTYTTSNYDNRLEVFESQRDRIKANLQENTVFMQTMSQLTAPVAKPKQSEEEEETPEVEEVDENTGQRIERILREFLDEVYGDDSTILRREENHIEADQGQSERIYETVVGLYQTVIDIVGNYLNQAKASNTALNSDLLKLLELGDKFYRSFAFASLLATLKKLFNEFNVAMNESKGEPTGQSNFINAEINRIVSFIVFVRNHNQNETADMKKIFDLTLATIEVMRGQKKPTEGVTVWQMFDDARNAAASVFQAVNPTWTETLGKVVQAFRGFIETQKNITVE